MTGQEWEVKAKAVINATGVFADAIRCVSPLPPPSSLMLNSKRRPFALPPH